MIYKILATTFILMNFATIANAAEEVPTVLYQTITQAEAAGLNIVIPKSTTPGFKSLEVNISGMSQSSEMKNILFCKDLKGVIHWDNICPDLTKIAAQTALEAANSRTELPPYNPLSNPKQSTDIAIIAFAALTLAAGAGAGALTTKTPTTPTSPSGSQPGYLAQLSRGSALALGTKIGRGDKAEVWQRPRTQKVDNLFTRAAAGVSGFSPLATRILSDGNYLRSLVGPFSVLIYPLAIGLGIYATFGQNQQALPPSLILILCMMAIGIIDSFAGLLTSVTFALAILVSGHLNSMNAGLTVVGVSLLAFSPTILASAFRPLRRAVWDFTSLWERATDYLLASVLTGWVVKQIVLGLPGLASLQLPLTIHANQIALSAAGLIILRFAAEDFAFRIFPQRLSKLQPLYQDRTVFQQLLATIFKVTIFGVIAGKFVGFSAELMIGVGLFALPLIMGIFTDKFPKSKAIQKWMPTGIIEMLAMTVAGYFLAIFVQSRYPNARTYVLVSFVILSLPGLILKLLALFGEDGAEDWKITKVGTKVYRVFGVVALGSLIYIILSGLLISNNV